MRQGQRAGRTLAEEAGSRATLADVARRAGVSAATVSRALAGNYPVATATRARIDAAVVELGYVANMHARALAGTRARTVGVIVADVNSEFFTQVVTGVETAASQRGYMCYVMVSRGSRARELEYLDRLIAQEADLVILAGGAEVDESYHRNVADRARALQRQGGQLAMVARPGPGRDAPTLTIMYDNINGGFALTEHLLARGHTEIMYVGGPPTHTTTAQRLEGYRRAFAARGLEVPEHLVREGVFSRGAGATAVRAALAAGHEFTAVFGGNDYVAAGAIGELSRHGLRVPDDVSVVGYDDIALATDITPKLTTVHVPLAEMGAAAVELALDEGSGYDVNQARSEEGLTFGAHVVIRASTARVRAATDTLEGTRRAVR